MLAEIELNEILEKGKGISTKGLTKDLINKCNGLNGSKYFYSGILHNYCLFISSKKSIKYLSGTTRIDLWKSNGMSEENIENIIKSDSSLNQFFLIIMCYQKQILMDTA